MESLLKAEGDTDALVAFYSARLDDRGQQHLTIARVLDEAGRPGDALGWAERGVGKAARPDARLIDYVVSRYTAADDPRRQRPLNWRGTSEPRSVQKNPAKRSRCGPRPS